MVLTSPAPSGLSNRHRSTAVAFSEKSAKLTPAPSQVAPGVYGCPGHTCMTFFLSSLTLPVPGCRGQTWWGAALAARQRHRPPLDDYRAGSGSVNVNGSPTCMLVRDAGDMSST